MIPGYFPIAIEQGATYKKRCILGLDTTPITYLDLTGYNLRGDIKVTYGANVPVITSILFNIVNAQAGTFDIRIPHTVTASIPIGQYVYDIELVEPSGDVSKFLKGPVYVSPEVTT